MRILAVDYGERRIGVAAGDDRTRLAVPLATISAGRDPAAAIQKLLAESPAEKIVVGLPVSLNGSLGPQAQQVQEFVRELSSRVSIPIETYDERFSTTEAQQRLGPGHRPELRDAVAASIILQGYFDSLPKEREA